jgi:regulator of sirC expression with transglutaminase-like and TPR domain
MQPWTSPDPNDAEDARDYLRRVGALGDEAIQLAETALHLAALDRPQVSFDRYRQHLGLLARDIGDAARDLAPGKDTLEARIQVLNAAIYGRYGYRGDSLNYDDLQNANLMRVIDRRRGLPVALGILYIHAARAQGWQVTGINFPAHFMVRLECRGRRAIIDPFNDGTVREVAELREMLKTSHGETAELDPIHYAPVGNRETLMRLQNNLKLRLTQTDDHAHALTVIESMLLITPGEVGLWYESGALQAKLGNLKAAIAALETYLDRAPQEAGRHKAAALLQKLRAQLN